MLFLLLTIAAVAAERPPTFEVDLLRPEPDATRVFVAVGLPDGSAALMLVDTGADVTVLSREVSDALHLERRYSAMTLRGLSDATRVDTARLPSLRIGELTLNDVEVAIDASDRLTAWPGLPIAGILGNNVWSNFVLDIDYRANLLRLHDPQRFRMPTRAEPMRFDGAHAHTTVTITGEAGVASAVLALDTGASDVIFLGPNAIHLQGTWTTGVEPVIGVNSPDGGSESSRLRGTRRIPLTAVRVGGTTVKVQFDARWIGADDESAGPTAVRGLVGHEVFEGRRLLIDYRGGEVALVRSGRAQRTVNAFQVLLDADEAAWGMSPERWLYRARLRVALGDEAAAAALLDRLLDTSDPDVLPDHAAARVLAAELARRRGDLAAAWHLLAPLSPAELVEQDEIIAVVEGLLLDGHQEEAIDVAEAAVRARPGSATAWVARAAVQRVQGDHDDAYASLQQAALLAGDEDAWLLERARVASARGDLNGALALLRDGMYTNPLDGRLAWFYALVSPPETRGDVITDLNRVEQLAHPKLRPLDFLTGAHHAVADDPRAHQLAAAGATADCSRGAQDQIDNCLAWYGAMVATDLDAALERILRAITARGPDPSLLDTLAMVRLARGERAQALQAATDAVRIAPEDPYLHWQRERIAALAGPAPQATQLDPATASPAGGGAPRGPRLRAPSTGSPRSPSNLTQDPIQAPLHTDTPAIPPR